MVDGLPGVGQVFLSLFSGKSVPILAAAMPKPLFFPALRDGVSRGESDETQIYFTHNTCFGSGDVP